MSKEEFLRKMGKTEEELKANNQEVVRYDDGDPEGDGWEIRFIDKTSSIGLGCKCSESGTLHNKL